jgi:hypothetical protein
LFRYEVRRWRNGAIPDVREAVASALRLSDDTVQARELLDRVPLFPTAFGAVMSFMPAACVTRTH